MYLITERRGLVLLAQQQQALQLNRGQSVSFSLCRARRNHQLIQGRSQTNSGLHRTAGLLHLPGADGRVARRRHFDPLQPLVPRQVSGEVGRLDLLSRVPPLADARLHGRGERVHRVRQQREPVDLPGLWVCFN